MSGSPKPLRAMVSYSHRDEAFREDLDRVLSSLKRQNLLEIWSDHKIAAGDEIDKSIGEALKNAEIVLLLISPDFVASEYCYSVELSAAMVRHDSNEAVVVPIIIRPTDWEDLSFSKLKCLPSDAKPISVWPNQDSAWVDVAKSLRELVADQARRIRSETGHSILPVRAHIKAEFVRLHERYESGTDLPEGMLRTGLSDLDACLDGLHKSDLVVIGSRPSLGDQDLLLQIAVHNVCKKKTCVLYLSPRDAGPRVMRRAISCLGRVRWDYLCTGDLADEDWPRVTAAITLLSEARLLIDDSANPSAAEMLARIAAVCSSDTPDAILIEGLDYFASTEPRVGLSEADISKRLRRLARDYNIPVIVSTTLSQQLENRSWRQPSLADLASWRCFEQEADQIIFVHNEEYYSSGTLGENAELIVAKNNHGSQGSVRATYMASYHLFGDSPD